MTKDTIIETIAFFIDTTKEDIEERLISKRKTDDIIYVKHIYRYLLYNYTKITKKEIALQTQAKDHTTTIWSMNEVNDILERKYDCPVKIVYQLIIDHLNNLMKNPETFITLSNVLTNTIKSLKRLNFQDKELTILEIEKCLKII